MYPFLHSFTRHLVSPYCMPDIILDAEDDKRAATATRELPVQRGSQSHYWRVINNMEVQDRAVQENSQYHSP